jgi:hypothetical protein
MSDKPDHDPAEVMNKVLFAVQDLDVMKAMIVLLGAMVITLAEGDERPRLSGTAVLDRLESFANLLARAAV